MARFLNDTFWEFVQNLPLVAGFVLALDFWRRGSWGLGLGCAVAGNVIGALLIAATEARIVEGHRESARVVAANIATMTALVVIVVMYMAAGWSNWATDVVVGAAVGFALGAAQDWADKQPVGLRHCVALACAAPVILIGVRVLINAAPMVVNIFIITLAATALIVVIDYGPGSSKTTSATREDAISAPYSKLER